LAIWGLLWFHTNFILFIYYLKMYLFARERESTGAGGKARGRGSEGI